MLAATLLTGAAACGGDDDSDGVDNASDGPQSPTEFGNLKPEDVRASPAEVAEGFRELNRYAADVVAKLGTDEPAAEETQERLLTIWESILGGVKANDEAAYDKLDTALSLLMTVRGTADKARAQEAAETISETGEAYLERFPGTGSAAPQSSASPSTSAEPDEGSDGGSDVEPDPPISY